eukprot:CAMPEP_0172170672 /NCGR_PEP_ID=MMETSP1050-20130122/11410_1 /TAXON_ID=233186 /ORGANISM="Cryptomonas curvata, Strain CCAP979/52" /LENGTH=491 /DNA_ID=CAMNT_0012841905 /DNA_START=361 /DNA_END=1832 /DNA_ORIENTATION=-
MSTNIKFLDENPSIRTINRTQVGFRMFPNPNATSSDAFRTLAGPAGSSFFFRLKKSAEQVRTSFSSTRRKEKIFVNSTENLDTLVKQGLHVSDFEIRGRSQPWRQNERGALLSNLSFEGRGDGRKSQLKHSVLEAIWQRARSGSKPGQRTDNFKIGLAIEGGGLRGCTTAGMASAIMHLGLSDSFDIVLGSSAGSIIGTYFVSKAPSQNTYEFFCNHLTTSKEKLNGSSWLDIGRIVSLFTPQRTGRNLNNSKLPVMVLDFPMKILMQDLLAVNWTSFQQQDKAQPMKIIASGLFSEESVVLGSEEGSFDDLESLCECVKASCMLPGVAGVDPLWRRGAPSSSPWKRAQGRARMLQRISRNSSGARQQSGATLTADGPLDKVRGAFDTLDTLRNFCTKTLTSARALALHKLSALGQKGDAAPCAPRQKGDAAPDAASTFALDDDAPDAAGRVSLEQSRGQTKETGPAGTLRRETGPAGTLRRETGPAGTLR